MPGTLVFDYPSVNAVTEYLSAKMLQSAAPPTAADVAAAGQPSVAAELALRSTASGDLAHSDWAPRQRHLAVIAVVARPLVADAAAAPHQGSSLPAAASMDSIHRVPLERWDLDQAGALLGEPLSLPAQASGCAYAESIAVRLQPALWVLRGRRIQRCPRLPTAAVWGLHARCGLV